MAAWRGPPSPHWQMETTFADRIEDDEKQKLCNALGEAGVPPIKKCRVFGLRSPFVVSSFSPSTSVWKASRGGYLVKKKRLRTKLTLPDDGVSGGGDGDAREKLLHQERHLKSATGAIIEDGEVLRKPLRQELERAPNNLQEHIQYANVNSDVFTLRSGVGTLYQRIVSVLRCFFCLSSSYSISASGENTGHDEAKSDQQRPEEARLQRSIIQLKRKDHLSDVDPTNLVSTVFQRSDQSASISDTHAKVISNSESEEMITLNLGGPGVLGGLSLSGYKHVVFSVCPASLVDPDLE